MNKYEDEITKLIKELEEFNESQYGLELSAKQCHKIVKCIKVLDKALDLACEELENESYVKGLGQVGMCYAEWKEYLLSGVEE